MNQHDTGSRPAAAHRLNEVWAEPRYDPAD